MLLEEKIRDLCQQAVRAGDEQDALLILEELRIALHMHIEEVRDKMIASSSFSAGRSRASLSHVSGKKAA